MSKIISIMVFLLLFVSNSGTILGEIEQNSIIYVDDDNTTGPWDGSQSNPYLTIQDAVDNASNGDTIFVREGRYNGHIVISKSIKLIGENRHKVRVIGGKNDFWIYADNVRIENFTIMNSSRYFSGIYVTSSQCSIINNIIKNNFNGLLINGGSSNIVKNNLFLYNVDRNIRMEFSSFTTISNNYFASGGDGIYVWSSSDNEINENRIENCVNGIIFGDSCYNNNIYHNNFIRNKYIDADDDSSENQWYNEQISEGNFWDSFNGSDNNNDGIGDDPFVISSKAKDLFPLMHPWNLSKPVVTIKNGIGFSVQILPEGNSSLTTLVEVIITHRKGFDVKNLTYELIAAPSAIETQFHEPLFGLGQITINVMVGPWSWEKQAFLFGPFVFVN